MIKSSFSILLIALVIFPSVSRGQNKQKEAISVKGVVVDSVNNKPLPGTVVSLFSDKDTLHFVTDTDGVFAFLTAVQPDYIEAAFTGYRLSRIKADKRTSHQVYDTIRMAQTRFELDAATVTSRVEMVVYKGDTVQFNAAAFNLLPGVNAGALIEKFPGITVDAGIRFQGQLVKGAYVDNNKVFGLGETGLYNLLNNLDAKDVISVEAFREISDADKHLGNESAPKSWVLNFITFSKLTEMTVGHTLLGYGSDATPKKSNKTTRYGAGLTLNYFGNEKGIFKSDFLHNNINRSTNKIDELSVSSETKPGESLLTVAKLNGSVFIGKKKSWKSGPGIHLKDTKIHPLLIQNKYTSPEAYTGQER